MSKYLLWNYKLTHSIIRRIKNKHKFTNNSIRNCRSAKYMYLTGMDISRGGHKPTTHGFTQIQTKLNGLGWVKYENGLNMDFI